ncbi:response regulator [Candidatus Saccharibacteria bacterium]|nr:response regulator [Candidatus Saccharibacteria bacterium]
MVTKILLLEPDRGLANNLAKSLKRAGHSVQWQVEPQAAMDAADSNQPDLIILDLLLAGRSGAEFLYELRSYPEWQALPVVVYSHVAVNELGETAISLDDLGIAAFHHKPVTSLSELLASVEQILAAQPVKL